MKKYIVEFIGTFFLVSAVGLATGTLAPLAIGAMLMIMVYGGGHFSGGHFNPAVTLAVWMRGKIGIGDVPGYVLGQILGGVVAALVVGYLAGGTAPTPKAIVAGPALVAELLGTFALAWVVLGTATEKDTAGNSFYGLAIGFTVMACAVAFGGISGGAFNPAVAIGASVMGAFDWANLWVYLVGTLAGAALAALVYKAVDDGQ